MQLVALPHSLPTPAVYGLHAQTTTASAIATIIDPSGAVIPGVQVTVTDQDEQKDFKCYNHGQRLLLRSNLSDSTFLISYSKPGFKLSTVTGIRLDAGQRRGQDIKLAVGSVDAKVTVGADVIACETESAESGGTISAKDFPNLMLNGRNFQQLATLVPGVEQHQHGANQQVNAGYLGQTSLIVGGASSEETTYTIDGVYDMTPTSLINVNITPSLDAINEMRILTNSYSAKYGYHHHLIDTKSGTSVFHGSGYEYIRNNGFGVARPCPTAGCAVQPPSQYLRLHVQQCNFHSKACNESRTKTFFFTGAEFKTNHYASLLIRGQNLPRQSGMATEAQQQSFRTSLRYGTIRGGDCGRMHVCVSHGPVAAVRQLLPSSAWPLSNLTAAICFSKERQQHHQNQINPNSFDFRVQILLLTPQTTSCRFRICRRTTTRPLRITSTRIPRGTVENDTIYRIDNINQKNLVTGRYMHEEVNDIRPHA